MKPHTPIFTFPFRVYYEDTDAGGVVYHANYIKYLERCRTEWLRHEGFIQSELAALAGVVFVAHKVNCTFLRPARLDESLLVTLALENFTKVRLFFDQQVLRGDTVLLRASIDIACVNASTLKPTAMPADLYHLLEKRP